MTIRFIDLFAGIGGFRLGFEAIGAECVFTSEINKFSRKTYAANHLSNHELVGDITKFPASHIPKHDLLLAGFPCQPFSTAGVSTQRHFGRGVGVNNEESGGLFMEIVKVLYHHKTPAFLLENVPNLIGFDKGKTFKKMLSVLTRELGYHVDYKIINSRHWLPQNRKRLFIAGFLKQNDFFFNAFFSRPGLKIPDLPGPVLRSILFDNSEVPDKFNVSDVGYKSILRRKKNSEWGRFSIFKPDDITGTLVASYHSEYKHNMIFRGEGLTPRRLMPRETARLMGFPDTFKIVCSNTQSYRQFGNAVCPPVVAAIAEYIQPFLTKEKFDGKE